MTTRYANDVIASCAFGLKVDSMADEQNEFYVKGKTASTFGFRQFLLFFAVMNFPNLMKVRFKSIYFKKNEYFAKILPLADAKKTFCER
jgi:cytochrome P450 family 9